jgi:uncharacterized protein YndB with AHSA1/START domain
MKITVSVTIGAPATEIWRAYTKIEPLRSIEYSFGERTAQLEFVQAPQGVAVRVTFDAEQTHSIGQQRDGWQAILNNFKKHVEVQGA